MGKILMLNDVRCLFLVLGEPKDYKNNQKFRWSATALIPYESPLKAAVDAALKEVAKEKWEKKWQAIYENIIVDPKGCCIIDGKRKEYDVYQGHWALTAHRQLKDSRPLVLDNDKSPIYKPNNELYEGKAGRIYSGCFVNLQVEFFAQDSKDFGKGLRATLLGIQRVGKGDAFGGGVVPTADAFGEIADGADADDLS